MSAQPDTMILVFKVSVYGWVCRPCCRPGHRAGQDQGDKARIGGKRDEGTMCKIKSVKKTDEGSAPAAVTCEYTAKMKTGIPPMGSAWGDWSR
jgi:hypothetical protein